jgi:hypothetical protein
MDRWSLSLSGNAECLRAWRRLSTWKLCRAFCCIPSPPGRIRAESSNPMGNLGKHILVRRYEAQNAQMLFQNVQMTLILKCIFRIYGWLPRNTTLPSRVSHEDALVPTCSHTFVDSFWIILNPSPVAVGRKCISSPATRGFDVPPESGCWAAQGGSLGAQGQPCLRTLGHGSRIGVPVNSKAGHFWWLKPSSRSSGASDCNTVGIFADLLLSWAWKILEICFRDFLCEPC